MTPHAIYIDCSADAALLVEQLRDALAGELVIHHGDPAESSLKDLMKGYELVLNGHTRMSRDVLEGLSPELKKIVFLGTGAASYIDLTAAEELEIAVVTISNYGDRSVAEHAFALMMAAARDVAAMDRALRAGEWEQRSGLELEGKTVGVVGQGGLGGPSRPWQTPSVCAWSCGTERRLTCRKGGRKRKILQIYFPNQMWCRCI